METKKDEEIVRFNKDFDLIPIGNGSFGTVYRAKSNTDNNIYAIKMIEILDDNQNKIQIEQEIAILKDCHHPNVVHYYKSWRKPSKSPEKPDKLYIMMNYCEHNLAQVKVVIRNTFARNSILPIGPVEYFILFNLVKEILQGVNYLHGKKIRHCNLKETNILLQNTQGVWMVKISDFGLAKVIESASSSYSMDGGNTAYMAPEVAIGGKQTKRADVHGLAVMFGALFKFDRASADAHVELKELLGNMMSARARDRPRCWDVLDTIRKAPIKYDLSTVRADNDGISRLERLTSDKNAYVKKYFDDKLQSNSN